MKKAILILALGATLACALPLFAQVNMNTVAYPTSQATTTPGYLPFSTSTSGVFGLATFSAVNTQTAAYQVLASDFQAYKTIYMSCSSTCALTLVASTSQPAAGQFIFVVNIGSSVTLTRSGQNINGGTSTVSIAAASATAPAGAWIISDGTNYEAALWGGSGISGLTTGYIPKATSSSAIGNSALDDGATTANTLTYSGSAGGNFTGTSAKIGVGSSLPSCTLGTASVACMSEGTAPTAAANVDTPYANSTYHALSIQNNGVDEGPAFTATTNNQSLFAYNTSQFSTGQLTAATPVYITGSAISVPSSGLKIGYQVGTRFVWHLGKMEKNANGTGAASFVLYVGTNGSTSDTAEVTWAWGTATSAVADNATVDVTEVITGISSGTATVYWTISPEHHLATTGWSSTAGNAAFSTAPEGTFTFNTATSGLKFGLGIEIASGGTMATVTINDVRGQAYNLY
jgi:hypothetical protein